MIAAIGMSVPVYRFRRSQKEYRDAVVRTSQIISKRLSYYLT